MTTSHCRPWKNNFKEKLFEQLKFFYKLSDFKFNNNCKVTKIASNSIRSIFSRLDTVELSTVTVKVHVVNHHIFTLKK